MAVLSILDVFEEPLELNEYTVTGVFGPYAMVIMAVEIMYIELGLESKHKKSLLEAYFEIIPKVNYSMVEMELRKG